MKKEITNFNPHYSTLGNNIARASNNVIRCYCQRLKKHVRICRTVWRFITKIYAFCRLYGIVYYKNDTWWLKIDYPFRNSLVLIEWLSKWFIEVVFVIFHA